jgi:hypothetical protein
MLRENTNRQEKQKQCNNFQYIQCPHLFYKFILIIEIPISIKINKAGNYEV